MNVGKALIALGKIKEINGVSVTIHSIEHTNDSVSFEIDTVDADLIDKSDLKKILWDVYNIRTNVERFEEKRYPRGGSLFSVWEDLCIEVTIN